MGENETQLGKLYYLAIISEQGNKVEVDSIPCGLR